MATEEGLIEARRGKAEKLVESSAHPYGNRFVATDEIVASRNRVLKTAASEEATANLPTEDELTGDEPHEHVYGRVIAKRGPLFGRAQRQWRCASVGPSGKACRRRASAAQTHRSC
ncbi:MAG: hypothetical protein R3A47_11640 [Polyangiales bacterium]